MRISNLKSRFTCSTLNIPPPHSLTAKLHLHTHLGSRVEKIHRYQLIQSLTPSTLCSHTLHGGALSRVTCPGPWTSARCLRAPSHQVRVHKSARLGQLRDVVGADHHRVDASARQNAEQQLSQAAELNFVSLPLLFGVTPRLCASQKES